jgi:hypothetical protein
MTSPFLARHLAELTSEMSVQSHQEMPFLTSFIFILQIPVSSTWQQLKTE